MSDICMKCHLPFAHGPNMSGGYTSEVRIYDGDLGPYHSQCLAKKDEPTMSDVVGELREMKAMLADLQKTLASR